MQSERIMMPDRLVAGIETGGTKILARLCDSESGETFAEEKWETGSADDAVRDLVNFLGRVKETLAAVGIAAFGPLIVDPDSDDYGRMLATTKPGWTGSNLRAQLQAATGVAVVVETDVNAAAVAEQVVGAGDGLPSVAYVTVGTGIGAGLAIRGHALKGALHPEAGHLPVIRRPEDEFASVCKFHSSCAEGMVSGPALRRRLGNRENLADDPDLVELVADYLGQLAASLVLAWSPRRIVWGGGVISAAPIVPRIEQSMRDALNGYGVGDAANQSGFCVAASLKNAGLEGAVLMARNLVTQATKKAP